jgi:hypothetical protein
MTNREIAQPRQPIQGLTANQLEWPISDLKLLMKDTRRSTSGSCDFLLEARAAREKARAGTKGFFLEPELSEDTVEFLKKNRPPTRFFNPQALEFLKPEPKVKFDHERGEKGEYEWWCFSAKIPDKKGYNLLLRLTRGKVPWLCAIEPYLIVSFFPAAYAGGNIIFSPHIENPICPTYGWRDEPNDKQTGISNQKKWEKKIIDGLGLKKHVVNQGLNFEVDNLDVKNVKISLKNPPGK